MVITLTTPAILFSAISLLLLAYTNRFLTLAALIRELNSQYQKHKDPIVLKQIPTLRLRVNLIKYMQALGTFSFLLSVLTMYSIFQGNNEFAAVIFGIGLLSLLFSLIISLWEIFISVTALNIHLANIEDSK